MRWLALGLCALLAPGCRTRLIEPALPPQPEPLDLSWLDEPLPDLGGAPDLTGVPPLWPMEGHDGHRRSRSEVAGPDRFDLRWELAVGALTGGPVVGAGGTIYVTRLEGGEPKLCAIAPAGVFAWCVAQPGSNLAIGRTGTLFLVDPGGGVPRLVAFNTDQRREKWSQPAPREVRAPLVLGEDDTIYFVTAQGAAAADPADGHLRWTRPLADPGTGVALGLDGALAVTTAHELFLLTAQDGSIRWRTTVTAKGAGLRDPVVGMAGEIYALAAAVDLYRYPSDGSNRSGSTSASYPPAIAENGFAIISFLGGLAVFPGPPQKWRLDLPVGVRSRPVVAGHTIYFTAHSPIADVRRYYLYAVDADSGAVKIEKEVPWFLAASPVLGEGVIYFLGDDGKLRAFGG